MKIYRNTLNIQYTADVTGQENTGYLLYPRSGGQLVMAQPTDNPTVTISKKQDGADGKEWPNAIINDGLVFVASEDLPYTEAGIYYIKLNLSGVKYPSSGLTTLSLNDYEEETEDGTPSLSGKPGTGIQSITSEGNNLVIKLTNGQTQQIQLPSSQGTPGPKGEPGLTGTGIATIKKGENPDQVDIVLTDGTNYEMTIPTVKGQDGKNGKDGAGIQSIRQDGNSLIVSMTDGRAQAVDIPTVNGTPGKDGNGIQSITQQGSTLTVTTTDGQSQSFTIPTVKGEQGPEGPAGKDGNGIQSITQQGDVLTVTTTDGNSQTFTIPTVTGGQGLTGPTGKDGNGIQSISASGSVLTVTTTDGSSQSFTIPTVKGDQGNQGPAGKAGRGIQSITTGTGTGSLTIDFTDGTSQTVTLPTLPGPKGDQGPTGAPGKDGTPGKDGAPGKDGTGIQLITQAGDTLTITTTDDKTQTVTIPTVKGDPGNQGPAGKDGRGIQSINQQGNELLIALTDGVTKRFTLPQGQGSTSKITKAVTGIDYQQGKNPLDSDFLTIHFTDENGSRVDNSIEIKPRISKVLLKGDSDEGMTETDYSWTFYGGDTLRFSVPSHPVTSIDIDGDGNLRYWPYHDSSQTVNIFSRLPKLVTNIQLSDDKKKLTVTKYDPSSKDTSTEDIDLP